MVACAAGQCIPGIHRIADLAVWSWLSVMAGEAQDFFAAIVIRSGSAQGGIRTGFGTTVMV